MTGAETASPSPATTATAMATDMDTVGAVVTAKAVVSPATASAPVITPVPATTPVEVAALAPEAVMADTVDKFVSDDHSGLVVLVNWSSNAVFRKFRNQRSDTTA